MTATAARRKPGLYRDTTGSHTAGYVVVPGPYNRFGDTLRHAVTIPSSDENADRGLHAPLLSKVRSQADAHCGFTLPALIDAGGNAIRVEHSLSADCIYLHFRSHGCWLFLFTPSFVPLHPSISSQ